MSDSVAIINHLLIDDILPLVRAYARPINPMAYALQCEFAVRHTIEFAEHASNVGHNRQYYDNLKQCLRAHEKELVETYG